MVLVLAAAQAAVRAYSVEPVKTSWSGATDTMPPSNVVAQTVTCCWGSLEAVHLFCGTRGDTNSYKLDVKDDSTSQLVAHQYAVAPPKDHDWLKFENLDIDGPFVKGKRYRFEFRRQGQESLQYYWDNTDPYPKYGNLKIGQDNEPLKDLACRVYGLNRPIRADFFGSHSKYFMARAFEDTAWNWAGDSMANAGFRLDRDGIDMFKLWHSEGTNTEPVPCDTMSWAAMDSYVNHMAGARAVKLLPGLHRTAYWCTSADVSDTSKHYHPDDGYPEFTRWASRPPIGLFQPAYDDTGVLNPANPFAVYLDSFFRRYGPSDPGGEYANHGIPDSMRCRYVEIWNEPNCFMTRPETSKVGSEHFQFPDSGRDTTYDRLFYPQWPPDSWPLEKQRLRCSLYVRMCQIAREVRDRTDDSIRLIGGAVAATRSYGSWPGVYVRGDTWLQWFAEMGGLDCVDGISVHFYHHLGADHQTYNDSFLRLDLLFLDSLLGANNARDKELWVSECGSPSGGAGIGSLPPGRTKLHKPPRWWHTTSPGSRRPDCR